MVMQDLFPSDARNKVCGVKSWPRIVRRPMQAVVSVTMYYSTLAARPGHARAVPRFIVPIHSLQYHKLQVIIGKQSSSSKPGPSRDKTCTFR